MPTYIVRDEGAEIEYEADSFDKAIKEWVESGWEPTTETQLICGWVENVETGEGYHFCYELDPEPPPCRSLDGEHVWRSPYSFFGGCRENPGVWGNGGGVIAKSLCIHCGLIWTTNSWASDGHGGHYTHESYTEDEDAKNWVFERKDSKLQDYLDSRNIPYDKRREGVYRIKVRGTKKIKKDLEDILNIEVNIEDVFNDDKYNYRVYIEKD